MTVSMEFAPHPDLTDSERADLESKIKKAATVKKRKPSKRSGGRAFKAVKDPVITVELLPEIDRRLRELGYRITNAVIGDDGSGEVEIVREQPIPVTYTITDTGHVIQDPAPPSDPDHESHPTLCGQPPDKIGYSDSCWECRCRLPDDVAIDQVIAFGARGYRCEMLPTRYDFLLDASPRAKAISQSVTRDFMRAVVLAQVGTPASWSAIDGLRHYVDPRACTITVDGPTPASELLGRELIERVGRDQATGLDTYALTVSGRELRRTILDKWEKLQERT